MTYGTVLDSHIVKETQAYHGSTQVVRQVTLSPFIHEWLRIGHFYGNVFDLLKYKVSIYGPQSSSGGVLAGLQFKTRTTEKDNATPPGTYMLLDCYSRANVLRFLAQSRSGFQVENAGSRGLAQQANRSPGDSFQAMASQASWPCHTDSTSFIILCCLCKH